MTEEKDPQPPRLKPVKPITSPEKRSKDVEAQEKFAATLRDKRNKRTREGGSWILKGGNLIPNEEDPRKGKKKDEPEPS